MILIRSDGNSCLGSGHIMRCLAIASEFVKQGEHCVFALADESPLELLFAKGFPVEVLHSDYKHPKSEIYDLSLVIMKYNPKVILVDSYYVDRDYFYMIRQICGGETLIVYIDDMREDVYPCDIVINYEVGSEVLQKNYSILYRERGVEYCNFLLGVKYAPLRDEFRGKGLRSIREKVENILFLTGGADVSHIVLKILAFLSKNNEFENIQFHFVIGKLNSDSDQIKKKSDQLTNVYIHENVSTMSELMLEADIAVSAGGTTLYEVCACGTPLIAYTCADNQIEGVKRIVENTGALNVGDTRENDTLIEDIFSNIIKLDFETRKVLSKKEQLLVDGNGTTKIVKSVKLVCEQRKKSVRYE